MTHPHPGELALRRLAAGEAVPADLTAHAAGCDACQRRLSSFADEQRAFMAALPFDRFADGVERAKDRLQREANGPTGPSQVRLLLAAGIVAVLGAGVWLAAARGDGGDPTSRIKGTGGAHVEFVIGAASGAQRTIFPDPAVPERLAPGDRLRIGVGVKRPRFITVLAIDAQGVTSPVYAVPVQSSGAVEYLSDSLELTGAGLERLVVIVSDRAPDQPALEQQLRERFERAGRDLLKLEPLAVDGEQHHRIFLKP